MIPVLYEASENEYRTNGLGRLKDAISCTVTEERNGQYQLELVYPVDGLHFSEITHSRQILALPSDGAKGQPFRIYKIGKAINGKSTIHARHVSYQTSYIPVSPFSATSAAEALVKLKSKATEDCPFTFWTDKNTEATFRVKEPCTMRSRFGGTEGSLLDVYGGEFEFDRYIIKLHSERGSDDGVSIRYGKNLTDLNQEENIENTYTGIYPYWKGNDSTGNEIVVELPEKSLYLPNASAYPYQRVKIVDLSSEFENQPDEAALRARAKTYMYANITGIPKVSLTVSFAPLWQTEQYKDIALLEHVRLCDTVSVEFPKIAVSAKAKVIKTVFNVLSERYKSVEIGEAKSSFTSQVNNAISDVKSLIANNYSTKTDLAKSVDRASKLLTGGLGGYVYIKPNADGEPEEILILADDPDYLKATKVWRFNRNGLGYSSTGYNGTYELAMTADGQIVADMITAGTLIGNIIRAGVIADKTGKNSWDLDTGLFSMENGTIKLGDNFEVNSSGILTAKDATINGEITSNTGKSYLSIRGSFLEMGTVTDGVENKTGRIGRYSDGSMLISSDTGTTFLIKEGTTFRISRLGKAYLTINEDGIVLAGGMSQKPVYLPTNASCTSFVRAKVEHGILYAY